MPINSRAKGQRGERAIIDELQPIVDTVTYELGRESMLLQRNTLQSDRGGYDIVGLPWFAPEVKWCEVKNVKAWWGQCVSQARIGQIPVLFYKSNNEPWRVITYGGLGGTGAWLETTVEVDMHRFKIWFRLKLLYELTTPNLQS